jgi:hypothetical protein
MSVSGEPRVLILGLPYFGELLAKALATRGWRAQYLPHPGRSPRGWAQVVRALVRADILYLVSARAEVGSPLARLLAVRTRPTVVHWVGTDVLIAAEEYAKGRLSPRAVRRPVHWCDAPWLAEELAEIGIAAELVHLPIPDLPHEAPPLPERFRVLLYLPVDAFDREVFDMETLLRLPKALPEVEFVLIPSPAESLPAPLPSNLKTPGWVTNMDALYREVTAVARLVSHDGLPFTALEAMSRGRYVVYPYELPGVTVASGFEPVRDAIAGLHAAHREGRLRPNEEGMAWVRENFDYDAVLDDLSRRLQAVAGSSPRRRRQPRRKT